MLLESYTAGSVVETDLELVENAATAEQIEANTEPFGEADWNGD